MHHTFRHFASAVLVLASFSGIGVSRAYGPNAVHVVANGQARAAIVIPRGALAAGFVAKWRGHGDQMMSSYPVYEAPPTDLRGDGWQELALPAAW